MRILDYSHSLFKIKDIAGNLYTSGKDKNNLIIYAIGAPRTPDNGDLADAKWLMKNNNVDIFVPDYIGYARSDGKFTPLNCIKTLITLYDAFSEGCVGTNYYCHARKKLKYKRIIFIGKSFGGSFVPILPRFNKKIRELAIFCPAVDNKSSGSVKFEETNDDFLGSMRYDGYQHLYRGILDDQWEKNLYNRDGLSPMDNIGYLKNVKLFIAHGKKDKCISYTKSLKYYKKIIETFPSSRSNFKLKLYENGDHGVSTTGNASKDFLKWFGIN